MAIGKINGATDIPDRGAYTLFICCGNFDWLLSVFRKNKFSVRCGRMFHVTVYIPCIYATDVLLETLYRSETIIQLCWLASYYQPVSFK